MLEILMVDQGAVHTTVCTVLKILDRGNFPNGQIDLTESACQITLRNHFWLTMY